MSDQMSTDALELYCRNRAKASGELTDYDRALLVDVSDRLCALQAVNAELKQRLDKMNDFEKSQCAKLLKKLSRVEAERDALLEYANAQMECEMCKNDTFCPMPNPMPENCALCELKPKCPCHPCKWEWRGAQEEGQDGD